MKNMTISARLFIGAMARAGLLWSRNVVSGTTNTDTIEAASIAIKGEK